MILYLKRDIQENYWIIVSEHGNVLSGPKFYESKHKAVDWANGFASSWSGCNLIVEE